MYEYLVLPTGIVTEMILTKKQSTYYKLGRLDFNLVAIDRWRLVTVDNGIAYVGQSQKSGY